MVSGFVLVALLTVGAKAVSFFKDAVVARQFGTGDELDAFMLSFGFLTFIAALVGGGLPEAFLPLYSETQHLHTTERAHRLAVQSSLVHALSLMLICAALWWAAPGYVYGMTRGFSTEKQALAVGLIQQLLPFLMCFGMSYQLGTWLRADKLFLLATCAPMLVPLTIVGFLLYDGTDASVTTLVHGTNLGALAQLFVLTVGLWLRLKPSWSFLWHCGRDWEPSVRRVVMNTLPFLFAGGIFSSAVVVDQTMAAWLESGSVSVLGYTDKVCGIILAVTVTPSCDVLFPYFADKVARKDWLGVRHQLFTSAGMILALALPAVLLLCWLATLVIELLFQRGSFTPHDTQRVADVLRYAALQIPFYIIGSLASRVVVAMQATRFIMILSAIGLVGNASLNWLLMRNMGVAGIALSTVLVQMLSAGIACLYVLRQIQSKLITAPASSGR